MAKEKKERKPVPFWAQIVFILICGILCSGIAFFAVKEAKKPVHVVTFAYSDGSVIDAKQVKDGKGVMPADYKTNDVFRGWSGAINHVTGNIEVHPLIYSITDKDENLFYFDSVYVKEGREFSIDLMVSGKVNVSSAKITLDYDPEVMTYKQSDCGDLCSAKEVEPGKLEISLISGAPVTETTHLAQITFRTKKKDVYASQIDVICENTALISGGKEISVTASTINNKIFFLQEVG